MYIVEDWSALARGTKVKAVPLESAEYAELVEFKPRDTDKWGEPYQGESECYIIFKVGERYFKKTGSQSSYGDETEWYGKVTEVFPKTVTSTVFE